MIRVQSILIPLAILTLVAIVALSFRSANRNSDSTETDVSPDQLSRSEQATRPFDTSDSLTIDYLRRISTPGSTIAFVRALSAGPNYTRHVVSYESENNTIYALMTIPNGSRPKTGWPAIIFNHGYIPPAQYRTTEKYVAYQDAFARAGYITFKSDYRGHGESEGMPEGAYGSPAYVIDVLNALASVKAYEATDPDRIGMWGHSMGGYITLRAMVARDDIKAGSLWAGVVGSYPDLLNNRRRRSPNPTPASTSTPAARRWRDLLQELYGTPESNPAYWDSISATSYLSDISGPIDIHHGTADTSVPVEFSTKLHERVQAAGRQSPLFIYQGDDHNLSRNLRTALNRSVAFFDSHLK